MFLKSKTILQYFFFHNFKIFWTVFFVMCIFFSLSVVIAASGLVLKYQIGYGYVARYIFLLMIKDVDRIIPFASFIACWIFISSIRPQVAVLNNFGISNFNLTKLLVVCYVPIFLILFSLSFYIRPASKKWIANVTHEIQKASIAKLIKEKEVISDKNFDIYIEKLNKQTMQMEDIVIRLHNACETTFVTAKEGYIEEDEIKKNLYLILQNSRVLSWGSKNNCTYNKNEKNFLLNIAQWLSLYKFEIISKGLVVNLTLPGNANKNNENARTKPTTYIIKEFFVNKYNFIVAKEFFYRIISPFFLFAFILLLASFLLPKSYGRQEKILSPSFLFFMGLFIYTIMSYLVISENFISSFKTLTVPIANLGLIYGYCIKKIKKT